MKKIIVTIALIFATTLTQAQKNFYEALEANGETVTYEGFSGISIKDDGTVDIVRGEPAVKITVTKLVTGQPVGFEAKPVSADYGGFSETEISDYGRVDSYPNVMTIKHDYTDDGYMAIDDMLFKIDDISDKGVPKLEDVRAIYVVVKDRSESKENKGKKKGGFLNRMKSKLESSGYSATHKYIKTVNIKKIFNDYVTAMKAKQANPLTSKDKADIAIIKRSREAGDEEIKRYNDSIKATPEYIDLQRRIKQNEANYQASKTKNKVTLRNNSGRTIYVGKSGSRNPGTKISSGGTATWNCDTDGYLQTVTKSGGSNVYSSTKTKVYSANSGCGSTITIN
ncbi:MULTISPECIES: hypothetical protein [Flavobacterium]|uniref:Uncharacterized protein n=1 Tax=Flavobacterium jumunjinense TaxID=998845 RepID=A0ABV5GPR4_9FLAO|nr:MULTISPECIES: hypothetical protein [Flavobacterium]